MINAAEIQYVEQVAALLVCAAIGAVAVYYMGYLHGSMNGYRQGAALSPGGDWAAWHRSLARPSERANPARRGGFHLRLRPRRLPRSREGQMRRTLWLIHDWVAFFVGLVVLLWRDESFDAWKAGLYRPKRRAS